MIFSDEDLSDIFPGSESHGVAESLKKGEKRDKYLSISNNGEPKENNSKRILVRSISEAPFGDCFEMFMDP